MSTTKHTNDNVSGNPAAMAGARPIVLVRARPGMAPEGARVVHLAPLPPSGTGAVSALCGALLRPEECETVTPGHGMPCDPCLASHLTTSPPPTPDSTKPAPAAAPDPTSPGTTPWVAALGYRAWNWPITLRRDQVWLTLGRDLMALLMPTLLAAEVTALLDRRRCLPAVLTHPYTPEHRVLLCGERYGINLPWPPGVHRVTGSLLLPPTVTPRGPLSWAHPPQRNSLRLSREIDVITAVRAVLRDPPSVSSPAHF